MGLVLSFINILCLLIIQLSFLADADGIGLNYGLVADNLPAPAQVISLVKSRNVAKIRIFEPNHGVLDALQNSGIEVIVGTLNADIANIANDPNFAKDWVQNNIVPYAPTVKIRAISLGNEVNPGDLGSMLQALKNLDNAVKATGFSIPVTTTIGVYLLASSYPPSQGDFSEAAKPGMQQVSGFLASNGYPIMVTAYPYFAYAGDPEHVPLQYALINSSDIVVRDGDLGYANLFDAMVDGVYAAMDKVGGGAVEVVVCESGWPSKGNGDFTTTTLAQTYNQNLVRHVTSSGTPRKPGNKVETYIFAIFNEDQKSPGVEQNFGLYNPDMTEVYHIDF
ncbi:putative licheninase [Helianthus debilis subsp. tardiflorus]